jgi:hypothetical protein
MPQPPANPANPDNLTILRADEANVESYPQDKVPQTPVTPVSADGFMPLQNVIIKQVAYILDNTSKQKFERHLTEVY